jgi:hypothetical protein
VAKPSANRVDAYRPWRGLAQKDGSVIGNHGITWRDSPDVEPAQKKSPPRAHYNVIERKQYRAKDKVNRALAVQVPYEH